MATTLHLALAALRNHRRSTPHLMSSLALVSAMFAAGPWLFPSPAGLAAGLFAHALWFAICERWGSAGGAATRVRPPAAAGTVAPSVTPRPPSRERPKTFVDLPVLAVIDETPDIRTFRLARPAGFDFVAGQFLTVRVRTDGQDQVRCYSISSAPEARGYLEISVKRQGLVSNALHAAVRPGRALSVRPPGGSFTYPAGDDRPLVCVAAGVGITPLVSMVRHGVLVDPTRPITLLYGARTVGELAFRDELTWLSRRCPQLTVTFAVSGGSASRDIYPGRIDVELLKTVPALAHAIALVCGPQGMIDGTVALLGELGVPPPQIRFERFDAAVAASSRARAATQPTRGDQTATYRLEAARSGRGGPVVASTTLLDAAELHGIEIPSICRAGVCGTCRTRVIEGDVECTADLLDDEDRRCGYVLACVSSLHSDCVIEA